MNDRFKFRMWSTHAGRYFDETNDAMLENVFECMKQQICYDCQNPVFRKIYDRIAYNHIADGMVFEQCTGLKDKNGKLIYEGDIIVKSDVSAIGYSRTRACKVHWHNDWLSWAITTQYGDTYELSEFEPQQYEIIGNIHENPELIGGDNV